jgi:hypothetical protein
MVGHLVLLVISTSVGVIATAQGNADPPSSIPHVRGLDRESADVLAAGLARSSDFRRLVDRIENTDAMVFIHHGRSPQSTTAHRLGGFLSHHVGLAGNSRVLHITLTDRFGDRGISVLAHELQHALEVLETPDARSDIDVDALFDRIGIRKGPGIVETAAALDVQAAVAQQLAEERRRRR